MRTVRPRTVMMVVVGVMLAAAPAGARSLRDQLAASSETVGISGGSAFDALAGAIADTAARNLPTVAASAGFTYRYDPELEIFERTSETLGPIFLERPDTIGRGKVNVNVSFQYVQFDAYDGNGIDGLQNPDPIVLQLFDAAGNPIGRRASTLQYRLSLQSYITAFSVTYGVLDDLDVNVLLPLIATSLRVGVSTQQVAVAAAGGGFAASPGPVAVGRTSGETFGIGDILLRLKYQLPAAGRIRTAAGLQLRLPSGDDAEFQGTGAFEASPFVYASTILGSRVEPNASLGLDLNADDVARSQLRYAIGVDVDVIPRIGVALAFLGRSEFDGIASPGDTSFQHLTSNGVAARPLLGVDFGRKDFFDLSFGVRGVLWRNIMMFANGIYALNDDGLRNDTIIPTVGFEGTF